MILNNNFVFINLLKKKKIYVWNNIQQFKGFVCPLKINSQPKW